MADAEVETKKDEVAPEAPAATTSAKKAKSPKKKDKKKTTDAHPKYSKMIAEAIAALKERHGSSRQAILKYIVKNYSLGTDERTVNNHLKMSLRAGIKNGMLKQSKGVGASGSFRLGDKAKSEKPEKKAVKTVKKSAKPAKKETKAKKSPAKVSKPKPAKAKKAAKAKSPKKKAAPKKAVKKDTKKSAKSPKKAKAKGKATKGRKAKAAEPAAAE